MRSIENSVQSIAPKFITEVQSLRKFKTNGIKFIALELFRINFSSSLFLYVESFYL